MKSFCLINLLLLNFTFFGQSNTKIDSLKPKINIPSKFYTKKADLGIKKRL